MTAEHDTAIPLTDGRLRPRQGDSARLEAFLPAPCVQNHAAYLTVLPGGDLGCVWFGGTQEGVPDISVYFSRLAPGADRWSEPVRLSDDPTRSEQNPLLFPAPDGKLWLLWTAQISGNQDTAIVRRRISARRWAELGADRDPVPGQPARAASSSASRSWCWTTANGCCRSSAA